MLYADVGTPSFSEPEALQPNAVVPPMGDPPVSKSSSTGLIIGIAAGVGAALVLVTGAMCRPSGCGLVTMGCSCVL